MAAARRPAARVGPATSPPSRFPQVNYCDFATLLAALCALPYTAVLAPPTPRRGRAPAARMAADEVDWREMRARLVAQEKQTGATARRHKKPLGNPTLNVVANANRSSCDRRLCRCVVPVRGCPNTNTGSSLIVWFLTARP